MTKKLKPVHPGEILLEEFMKPLGLSMNKVALSLRVPITRIADIVGKRRGITADTALRLARYFQNAPVFWMNLQTRSRAFRYSPVGAGQRLKPSTHACGLSGDGAAVYW